jgi:hypothetical protein
MQQYLFSHFKFLNKGQIVHAAGAGVMLWQGKK